MKTARWTATLLATMATALVWLDLALSPGGLVQMSVTQATVAGGLVLAPLALMVASHPSGVTRFAVLLLTALPAIALVLALTSGDSALAHWPLAVAALASALAILTLAEIDNRDPMPTACFPLGAVLLAVGLAAISDPISPLLWPEGVQLLTRTAVHLALTALAAVVLAGLLIAALRRSLSARASGLLRALIGLLPLLGFTGTILGIIQSLAALPEVFDGGGPGTAALAPVLAGLSTAFETTLIGLVAAVCAGFFLALLQSALSNDRA